MSLTYCFSPIIADWVPGNRLRFYLVLRFLFLKVDHENSFGNIEDMGLVFFENCYCYLNLIFYCV